VNGNGVFIHGIKLAKGGEEIQFTKYLQTLKSKEKIFFKQLKFESIFIPFYSINRIKRIHQMSAMPFITRQNSAPHRLAVRRRTQQLFCLVLLYFFHNSALAQAVLGKWQITNVYITNLDETPADIQKQYNDYRDNYLKENKVFHHYKPDGTLVLYEVNNSDTIEFGRRKWWMKGNKFYTDYPNLNNEQLSTAELKNNMLIMTTTVIASKQLLSYTFSPCNSCVLYDSQAEGIPKYYAAGIPHLNRTWTFRMCRDAIDSLLSAESSEGLKLPNQKDKSVKILQKINVLPIKFEIQSLDDSLNDFYFLGALEKNMCRLTKTYLEKSGKTGTSYSTELKMIQLKTLEIGTLLSEVGIAWLKAPNPVLEQYTAIRQFQSCDRAVFELFFNSLRDHALNYKEADACTIYSAFFEFYAKYHASSEYDEEKVIYANSLKEIVEG
jgi:hypothetical protein